MSLANDRVPAEWGALDISLISNHILLHGVLWSMSPVDDHWHIPTQWRALKSISPVKDHIPSECGTLEYFFTQ